MLVQLCYTISSYKRISKTNRSAHARVHLVLQLPAFAIRAIFHIALHVTTYNPPCHNLFYSIFKVNGNFFRGESATIPSHSQSLTPRGRRTGKRHRLSRAKRTNAQKAHRPALSSLSEVIAMLKGPNNTRTKCKSRQYKSPRRIIHKATQSTSNSIKIVFPFWKGIYSKRKNSLWEQILIFLNRPLFGRDRDT